MLFLYFTDLFGSPHRKLVADVLRQVISAWAIDPELRVTELWQLYFAKSLAPHFKDGGVIGPEYETTRAIVHGKDSVT